MSANDTNERSARLGGLRRFAIAITAFNILGHLVLGFEQSLAQPVVALATAYSLELLFETINAGLQNRKPYFTDGITNFVDFLLSAHITGLAVSMLLYVNDRLWPIAFATAVAISSKALFRIKAGKGTRHFLNPSNFGITMALLLFPWIGIAPPYHFSENLGTIGDWLLPAVIVVSGSLLNWRFTHRIVLIGVWLSAFFLQALVRSVFLDSMLGGALMPMTGVAFILYTFYMVTDPATTPGSVKGQVMFGSAVAVVYGLLMVLHVVFGLFFALTIVSGARGLACYVLGLMEHREHGRVAAQAPAVVR